MKQFLALAAATMIAPLSHSASISCSAETLFPAQIISGTCSAGRCTGVLPSTKVSALERCSDGTSFNSFAIGEEGSVVGRCNGEEFVAIGSAVILNFNGKCANGGVFNGRGFIRPQWISGTCSNDGGSFSAAVSRWTITVNGSCEPTP